MYERESALVGWLERCWHWLLSFILDKCWRRLSHARSWPPLAHLWWRASTTVTVLPWPSWKFHVGATCGDVAACHRSIYVFYVQFKQIRFACSFKVSHICLMLVTISKGWKNVRIWHSHKHTEEQYIKENCTYSWMQDPYLESSTHHSGYPVRI